MRRRALLGGALALPAAAARAAGAAGEVVVGCLYPLTGPQAQPGLDARVAVEVGADIVNTRHPPLPIAMGQGGGLARLGGATIRLVFEDSRDDPAVAAAAARRLVREEGAVAVLGSGGSPAVAAVAAATREMGVPYVSADNIWPQAAPAGVPWFFRIGPHDGMFSAAMFAFFRDIGARTGRPPRSVALVHEKTPFGTDSSAAQRELARKAGIRVVADIGYQASSPGLATEMQRLKVARADVVMPSSNASDAILMMREMQAIGYRPRAVMAQGGGFQAPSFLTAAGGLAEGVMSRSSFALDAVGLRPAIPAVNRLYRARAACDLDDNAARELTSLLVLAEAIERAGVARPEAIRAALVATDIDGAGTIMPWRGVRFDADGQNRRCDPVIQQVFRGVYRTIWPFGLAAAAPVWGVGA